MEKQHPEHRLRRSPRKAWEGRASKRLLRPFSPSCRATQPSCQPRAQLSPMPRLSSSPTSRTDHGDTLREGAACGAGPGAAGCHQRARPWLCWGAPAAPHCWGGAAGPQETSCPRLGAPHPVFTVLCAHPGLRQPRPSPDSRGASGEGLGVRGLHKDPPRQPGPAPRAGQGPAPPPAPSSCTPQPLPRSPPVPGLGAQPWGWSTTRAHDVAHEQQLGHVHSH